ncbi:unnamed protein product [Spirodela intermedia]|uniref:Uncharacterized protein n=1 Tax=Spirodela intermedia TaxID=51605 RepID=A0ABN7ECP1_SPIIN|nr:unnamed protein product [Spirodela intermedia]
MNHTIIEKIRCILSHIKLPNRFLDEILRTFVDLINLSLCITLNDNVTEHIWLGKNVSYKHLMVFGYNVFEHVSSIKRSKLDDKTRECIFFAIHMINLISSFRIEKK